MGWLLVESDACALAGATRQLFLSNLIHPDGRLDLVEHYAEAFCLLSERCFRFIQAEDGTGHAQHCPYLTEWRGRFKDGGGSGTPSRRASATDLTSTPFSGPADGRHGANGEAGRPDRWDSGELQEDQAGLLVRT